MRFLKKKYRFYYRNLLLQIHFFLLFYTASNSHLNFRFFGDVRVFNRIVCYWLRNRFDVAFPPINLSTFFFGQMVLLGAAEACFKTEYVYTDILISGKASRRWSSAIRHRFRNWLKFLRYFFLVNSLMAPRLTFNCFSRSEIL